MSLYSQLLAALGGAPTQDHRLVKLHTPLGPDVLLAERIDVHEAIVPTPEAGAGAGFRIEVHALSTDAHLELKRLIGQPVLVELLTAASRTQLRPWHGHVTEAALVGSDGGLARYRLVVEPWLAFLGHRRDSWVFQHLTVPQIIEEVFAGYQGAGTLVPEWRWDLADPEVYPCRSLCIQYQESDLDFVGRLLREEGLFAWFEHEAGDEARHRLVIADHNGAFAVNAQPRVRYTQGGAALKEDSLIRWEREAAVRTTSLEVASWDYRGLSLREVAETGSAAPVPELRAVDMPGVYAYESLEQGQRLARVQMQAIDALRERMHARGPWRGAAVGTTFTLTEHPVHDGRDDHRDRHVVLNAHHRARNNLSADVRAQVRALIGAVEPERRLANDSDEPLHECRLVVQRAAVPVRAPTRDARGEPDPRLSPRPTVHGLQTAIVTGTGGPIHTDRDHRIKIQFHWQRGERGSHGLPAPEGDNAPANDASGTWVRVGEAVAGANWGAHFTPRVGQEVLVAFLGGDIDRPVVLGSVYNGTGQVDAQGNQIAAGAAGATGNAPPWFPGEQAQERFQGHGHAAVLSGFKTQEMGTSANGTGGYNQLVFDDSPGAARIELSTTTAATRLQLGHLLNQNDNQRLHPRGHGLDMTTHAWGALRAGSGLLLSAHARPGSQGHAPQLDTREPQAVLQQAHDSLVSWADSAQAHHAKTPGEAQPPQLRAAQALDRTLQSLRGTDHRETGPEADASGGVGSVPMFERPDLVAAAPGGIGTLTPANTVMSAGGTFAATAQHDLNTVAGAHHAVAARDGLVLFTYGQARNTDKPNTETGIKLHAASGSVSVQAQSGAARLAASGDVDVGSTNAMVKIAAPKHVLLTAAGAGIEIQGGNITLKATGSVQLKASMKVLEGPGSASSSLELPKAQDLYDEQFIVRDKTTGEPLPFHPYRIERPDGQVFSGLTDEFGRTLRVGSAGSQSLKLFVD
jgi:type VI secretion system secreted protein VgrG